MEKIREEKLAKELMKDAHSLAHEVYDAVIQEFPEDNTTGLLMIIQNGHAEHKDDFTIPEGSSVLYELTRPGSVMDTERRSALWDIREEVGRIFWGEYIATAADDKDATPAEKILALFPKLYDKSRYDIFECAGKLIVDEVADMIMKVPTTDIRYICPPAAAEEMIADLAWGDTGWSLNADQNKAAAERIFKAYPEKEQELREKYSLECMEANRQYSEREHEG